MNFSGYGYALRIDGYQKNVNSESLCIIIPAQTDGTAVVGGGFIHGQLLPRGCRGRSPCLPWWNIPKWRTNRADTGVRPYGLH